MNEQKCIKTCCAVVPICLKETPNEATENSGSYELYI